MGSGYPHMLALGRGARIQHLDLARHLLEQAGITLDGGLPYDLQVHHPRTITRMLAEGRVGIGESYMDGWWDCDALDEFVCRILRSKVMERVDRKLQFFLAALGARLHNLQNRRRAFQVGQKHYDLGNDLFETMLDSTMTYTCAYWDGVDNLDAAQHQKLDLVCRKIGLEPGMRVLDIGCGYGPFARHAAARYGAEVTGLTVSREQADLATRRCAGLPVEIRLQDYRDIDNVFDRVVSLGMFEHVGYKNYRRFMEIARASLAPDGLFLLHTIGGKQTATRTDPWIEKYIFPNGMLPSVAQVGKAVEGVFVMEDWHNFGADYDKTLMAWWRRFRDGWPGLEEHYGGRFYRMWRYYLLTCAGAFRARHTNLWQIVLSPEGVPGGYRRPHALAGS